MNMMQSVLIDTDTQAVRFTCHTTGQQHAMYVAAIKEGLSAWKVSEANKEITPPYEAYESESTMRAFIRKHVINTAPYIDEAYLEGGQFGMGA